MDPGGISETYSRSFDSLFFAMEISRYILVNFHEMDMITFPHKHFGNFHLKCQLCLGCEFFLCILIA